MSKREKVLLYSLLFVICVGVLYMFVFKPQQEKIKEIEASVEENEELIARIEATVGSIARLRREITNLEELIANGLSDYFTKFHQSDALTLIDYFIEDNPGNVKAVNFIEGVPEEEFYSNFSLPAGYNVINARVVYEGTYTDFMDFLDKFYNFRNTLLVSYLDVSANETTKEIVATVRLSFVVIDNETADSEPLFKWGVYDNYVLDPFELIEVEEFIENYEYLR